ncbi:uncharacterized protein MKK02DRAFT_28590 [Dioszegia hungarica]|uniref:F-box domain-containing protein n=1 Tax=Dioszegia hungarica TaxID=4972 RepID=A0AA38H4X7_9TREE|nr:uncharacterized protein MKK02DRAFT_28590 [Dioszegia hungarica]KAI9633832.1 hypothetical protein MKK02DRAFT_28590 [Dioszegia hungarica]
MPPKRRPPPKAKVPPKEKARRKPPTQSVPSDIWHLILPYLRNPTPAPLSRPPRSQMCQPDLCSASLTCRLFAEIVNPLLYTHITTDQFALLFRDINNPTFYRRFRQTRSLLIEYMPTGEDADYGDLMADEGRRWSKLGRTEEEMDAATFKECGDEAEGIIAALGDFHPLGVFPFSSAKDPRTPTVNYTRTCHMAPKTSNLSISLGLPMRWASDYAGEEHWDEMAKIASDCVGQVAGARARFKDVPDYKAEVVDLEVCCTTRPPADGWGVKPIGERLQARLRATGHPEDRVRWYPSSETPICEACGSVIRAISQMYRSYAAHCAEAMSSMRVYERKLERLSSVGQRVPPNNGRSRTPVMARVRGLCIGSGGSRSSAPDAESSKWRSESVWLQAMILRSMKGGTLAIKQAALSKPEINCPLTPHPLISVDQAAIDPPLPCL